MDLTSIPRWTEAQFDADSEARRAAQDAEHAQLAADIADQADRLGVDDPTVLRARLAALVQRFDASDAIETAEATALADDAERVLGSGDSVTARARAYAALLRIEDDAEANADAVLVLAELAGAFEDGADPRAFLALRRTHARGAFRYYSLAQRSYDEDGEPIADPYLGAANALWDAVVADHVRLFGADDPVTLDVRGERVSEYCEVSDHVAEAGGYAALAKDLGRVLGPAHRDTLSARTNHVTASWESDDPQASAFAQKLAEELLGELGPDDELVQSLLADIDYRASGAMADG